MTTILAAGEPATFAGGDASTWLHAGLGLAFLAVVAWLYRATTRKGGKK